MTFSPLDSTLHGPLFTTPEMTAVFSDRARIAAMLRTELALSRAEAAVGLVPETVAPALEAVSADDFDLAALGQATALSGVAVIPFLKALQGKVPKDVEPFVHKGATTQDITDTALALQMRAAFALIAADLVAVLENLAHLAETHASTPCVGRTYGQHAVPLSFGFKVAGWLAGVSEVAARLPEVQSRLDVSLGGPVGTLSALGGHGPEVVKAMAGDLGLAAPVISTHTRRAGMVEIGTWLATLLGALGKMASDIANLASTEVGEVAEPYVPGRGGSSAMPHKRNPVSATVILASAQTAQSLLPSLFSSMIAAHERPAGAWHAEWHVLPQLFGLSAGALSEAKRLALGLEVNTLRMQSNLDLTRGLIYADAAASALTPLMGRGPAHHFIETAAAIVREADTDLQRAILAHPDRPAGLDEAQLAKAFDPAGAITAAARWVAPVTAQARQLALLLKTTHD